MNIIINPAYHNFEKFVNDIPDHFNDWGETIYKGRNEVKKMDVNGQILVVKSFKIPHIINKIAYSYFRASKAKRSYEYSLKIIKKGSETPDPIAYIEIFQCGLLNKSYYIYKYCEYNRTFKEFDFRPGTMEGKEDILTAFGAFTAKLHNENIYHPDYSNGNILFKKENGNISFALVDVNRMIFKKVTEDMSYRTFHRLDSCGEMLKIIGTEYAKKRGFDVDKYVEMITYYNIKTMKYKPLEEWPPLGQPNTTARR